MRKFVVLAAALCSLYGCDLWGEGDPPPPPYLMGEWFAADTAEDTVLEFTFNIDHPETAILVGDLLLQVTEPEEPRLDIRGVMIGAFDDFGYFVDMDFTLVAAGWDDVVKADFEGSYEGSAIRGHFILDPYGQPDSLWLELRRP